LIDLGPLRSMALLIAALLGFSCYPVFPEGDDDSSPALSDDDDSGGADDDDDSGGSDDDDSGGADDDDSGSADDDDDIELTEFWFTGVTLYDLDSDPDSALSEQDWITYDQNIAVEHGWITEITDELPADVAVGQIIDEFDGRVVLPGFIDSRVQLAEDGSTTFTGDHVLEHLRAQLAAGVTTVIDSGGPTWLFDLRDRTARSPGSAGHILGPRILASGPYLTSAGQYPCEANLRTDRCQLIGENETSTTATDNLLDVVNSSSPDFRSLVLETTDILQDHVTGPDNEVDCLGTVCGSISSQRRNEVLASLDAMPGVSAPVMIYALREGHYTDPGNNGTSLIASQPLSPKAIMAQIPYLEPISSTNANYSTVANYFSHSISGLTAIDALSRAIDFGSLLWPSTSPSNDPVAVRLAATVPAVSRQAWVNTLAAIHADPASRAGLDFWYENTVADGAGASVRAWQDNAASLIGRLMPYSLDLVAGSGAGSLFVPHGLGLHLELLKLEGVWLQYPQSLGYTSTNTPTHWTSLVRREALRAATSLPASLLGLDDRGSIAVGKRADFIVLAEDADPLWDLTSTQEIDRIFLAGDEYRPEDLGLSSGEYAGQVVPLATPGDSDDTCFVDDDCNTISACDLVNHQCRLACSAAADLDYCDDQLALNSYCAAADGLPAEMACSGFFSTSSIDTDGDGVYGCTDDDCLASGACSPGSSSGRSFVCRKGAACNPYFHLNPDLGGSNLCPGSAAPYDQNCVPADLDTNACIDSGRGTPELEHAGQCQTRAGAGTRTESPTACMAGLVCDWALASSSASFTSNSCEPLCDASPGAISMSCPYCNPMSWPNSAGLYSDWYGVCEMPGFQ